MYTPILASLGFVLSEDGRNVLLVHRNKREKDHHFGKYNGLGGKMEGDEDIVQCLKRELREEAGIEAVTVQLRGTINWKGFGGEWDHWFGFIFIISKYTGCPYTENDEGELVWKEIDALDTLPMWEGDRYFLPLVFDGDPRVFHGVMPYKNGRPVSWSYTRI